MSVYRIIVKRDDITIGEFETFTRLHLSKRLNNYGTSTITIPIIEEKLTDLVELRKNTVWIYRQGELVWSGEMAVRSGDLNSAGSGLVDLQSYTWFEQFRNRFTEQEIEYEQVDAGEIAWDLIYRSQNQFLQNITDQELPGTAANDNAVGTLAWTNANNIKVDDSTSATVDHGASETNTNYIKATNFGFALPTNANVIGIKVYVKQLNDKSSPSHYTKDSMVRIIKAGTVQSANYGNNTDRSETVSQVIYGGTNDLWGTTWTYSDINNSGFGIALAYTGLGSIINVYSVKVEVYYTTPVAGTTYDFGITKGTIEASMDRDRTYNNQNIAEAITNLTNVISGFDFEITDNKVFNVKELIGEDKTDSVILDYGSNVLSCRIIEDFTNPVNRAIVIGESSTEEELLRVERNDTASQTSYLLREDVSSEMDISETETLEERGDLILRKYAQPLLKVDIDILPNSPTISDFALGDLVMIRIIKGFYNIKEEYRVFEWEVTYESDGREVLSLVLGKFTI